MDAEVSGGRSHNFKVVLLGEGCVGKTSLVMRYVEDVFNTKHVTTLQASFLNKKISLAGRRINLSIWDTAGQERFHALGPIYYRASNGAILVYDITDQDSFEKVILICNAGLVYIMLILLSTNCRLKTG
jgi:Ras-related protein Rab-21